MKLVFDKKRIIRIFIIYLGFLSSPLVILPQEANPLPYAANWEDGLNNYLEGYSTGWQMENIEKGHHILLHFGYYVKFSDWQVNNYWEVYFRGPLQKAARYGIPITIETTQPEALLNENPWRSLPSIDNPNVVRNNGTVENKVSPFGGTEYWEVVGKGWVNPPILVNEGYSQSRNWWSNPILSQFQNWYPDPPFVIWLSNNEAGDVDYLDVDEDYRFGNTYGSNPDYDTWQFRNEVIGGETDLTNYGGGGYETGHGYIPRYNAMFDGMRDELDEWSDKVKFVCYIHDPLCFGRWDGWVQYISNPIPGRFSTLPFMWDGSSTSYYVNDWQANSDYTGFSPQLEAMNLLFQKNYYQDIKDDFWWEMSTWFDPDYIDKIENEGQDVPPERYGAYVKWAMWLTRPKAVRDFKYSTETRAQTWQWYETVVDAVDEIHLNSTLERFWKYSEPLLLTDIPHPWQYNDEYWPNLFPNNNERMRWYQLPNNLTHEPTSSDNYTSMRRETFNVWIMANVMGTSPGREWLIYGSSPLESEKDVQAEIPGYGTINITVERGGTYYLVRESGSNEYITTGTGVRAVELDDIVLHTGEVHLFNGIYSTAYRCDITDYSWDFGDGTTSDDIAADHAFSGAGTYQVQLTVTSDGGHSDSSTMQVTVTGGGSTTTSSGSTTTTSGGSTTTTSGGSTTTTSGGSTTTTSSGNTTTTTSDDGEEESLKGAHNFPNPFNPENSSTNIRYCISKETNVTIKIFDTGNNLVKTLIEDETQQVPPAGHYDIEWDGKNGRGEIVANGLYFFLIATSAGDRKVGKIAVIR